jgi:hypothetical protein
MKAGAPVVPPFVTNCPLRRKPPKRADASVVET